MTVIKSTILTTVSKLAHRHTEPVITHVPIN